MNSEDFFSDSYVSARERFVAAATAAGFTHKRRCLRGKDASGNTFQGPNRTVLTLDIAVRKGPRGGQALVITSGLHGVEGYFGSAAQLALLSDSAWLEATRDRTVVMLHALNPYGFARDRRWNETNVDLNRSFFAQGATRPETLSDTHLFVDFLAPKSPPPRIDTFLLQAVPLIARHGLPKLERTIVVGQYDYPKCLFFGGERASWTQSALERELPPLLDHAAEILLVDLHTGLGRYGTYQILLGDEDRPELVEMECRFSAAAVEDASTQSSGKGTGYKAHGLLTSWFKQLFADKTCYGVIAEFGTYSKPRMLQSLRAENRAHWHKGPQDRLRRTKANLREMFAPADRSWRSTVVNSARRIGWQALSGATVLGLKPVHATGKTYQDYPTIDATEMAARVRRKEVSPRELVEAAIARIEALDDAVSALSARTFDTALEAADRCGEALANGTAPQDAPFYGVPFLTKDLNGLEGAPCTFGSRMLAGNVSKGTTPVIARMCKTGLIPIGRTKTSEFGLLPSCESLSYGPVLNPWGLDYSTGGSSGGSAAAVAAGYVPIAHAGDGGGSIRIPASHCGVFGLKTSRHRLPLNKYAAPGNIQCEFCISRSVRDSARLLAAIETSQTILEPVGLVEGPSKRRLRLAISTVGALGRDAEPDVKNAVEDAARLCESLGHSVELATPKLDTEQLSEAFLALWAFVPGNLVHTWRMGAARLAKRKISKHSKLFEPWTLGLAEWHRKRRTIDPDPIRRAIDLFQFEALKYNAFFDDYDVWVTPVFRSAPPRRGGLAPDVSFDTLLERVTDLTCYTPIHNALGAPAMSVPLGRSHNGLPIGVHFSTRWGGERSLLELAYELEAAAPWSYQSD